MVFFFSLCFILDSLYCYVCKSTNLSSIVCNLLLIPSSTFFIADIIVFTSRISNRVFKKNTYIHIYNVSIYMLNLSYSFLDVAFLMSLYTNCIIGTISESVLIDQFSYSLWVEFSCFCMPGNFSSHVRHCEFYFFEYL